MDEISVTAINDQVTVFQQRHEALDHFVNSVAVVRVATGGGFHEDHHLTRTFEAGDKILESFGTVKVLVEVFGDEFFHRLSRAVVDGNAETATLYIQHEILPHHGEANKSEIALAHVNCPLNVVRQDYSRFQKRKRSFHIIENGFFMTGTHFTCSISEETIDAVERTFALSRVHGSDLRFHGVVRDLEDDRKITGIEYSHYDKMALNELLKIGEAMGRKYPEHLAHIHHRLGFVAAGEPSIIIRIQTPNSAESFEISREYLKCIKQTVPIWKKPVFED